MTNKNYKTAPMNGFEEIHNYTFTVEGAPIKMESKLFLKEKLDLTGMQVSYGIYKPSQESPFMHTHKQNEEVYIIVKGNACFTIDGEEVILSEGGSINLKPTAKRHLKNLSDSKDLIYITIQAKENSLEQDTLEDGEIVE